MLKAAVELAGLDRSDAVMIRESLLAFKRASADSDAGYHFAL
jgi:delta-aminolevulinic acid dehydratase/porphobilinogen synthase